MTLVLDIEHLLGTAFAAKEPDNPEPDWPLQPDRVFSALVATWGAHGGPAEERRALEWLEAQPTPEIAASSGYARTAPVVFVPPNDPETGRVGNTAVMPLLRRRQARRFPAFRPDEPTISVIWRDAKPEAATLAALNRIAADTAYVGHSASLTRCRFRDADPAVGRPARRRVYPGRLAELERDYSAHPLRRPRPGAAVRDQGPPQGGISASLFSEDWEVLEHVAGEMPDIRATPLIAKSLRNAIMSGYRRTGSGDAIPAALSGHAPDGTPSKDPHLAIAPLAFLGWPNASGAVLGFALVPPRGSDLFGDPAFRSAVRSLLGEGENGRRILRVQTAAGAINFAFGSPGRLRSLESERYLAPARFWASCTPIVLDRHLKEQGNEAREQEIRGLIVQACRNTGLPEPRRVMPGKHSAIEGTPPAYPAAGSPRWMRWHQPDSLASRRLTHAVIEFAEPVHGPVILGAGRFVGMGLCLPLDGGRRS